MNRLELAAQAPPIPDWYRKQREKEIKDKISTIANNSEEVKEIQNYIDSMTYTWKNDKRKLGFTRNSFFQDDNDVRSHLYIREKDKEKEIEKQYKIELIKQLEVDWRFYWADEMIKRNDTETSSNNNRE